MGLQTCNGLQRPIIMTLRWTLCILLDYMTWTKTTQGSLLMFFDVRSLGIFWNCEVKKFKFKNFSIKRKTFGNVPDVCNQIIPWYVRLWVTFDKHKPPLNYCWHFITQQLMPSLDIMHQSVSCKAHLMVVEFFFFNFINKWLKKWLKLYQLGKNATYTRPVWTHSVPIGLVWVAYFPSLFFSQVSFKGNYRGLDDMSKTVVGRYSYSSPFENES